MHIVVYKGSAQYNAFNRFAEKLGEGLQQIGHQVDIIDLIKAKENIQDTFNSIMLKKPNLVISFNGIGAEIKTGEKSVYDVVGCYFLQLLLDHPAFHTGRVARAPHTAITGAVDKTHIDYMRHIWPQRPSFFAPHGGIQHPDYTNTDRPIDILFLGTGLNPEQERKDWSQLPRIYQSIMHEAFEEFMAQPQAWEVLIAKAAAKHSLYYPPRLMAPMIVQLEVVARAEYRLRVLKAFDKAGIQVTVMGNGWDFAKFKHHQLHSSVEFYEALKLMCQSKISLNASPQFFRGTHERVFASMLNNSVAFTSDSDYYREHFVDSKHYIAFELASLKDGIDSVKALLAAPRELADIRHNALKIAERDHTWRSRAEEFMDKFQLLAVSGYLTKKNWF